MNKHLNMPFNYYQKRKCKFCGKKFFAYIFNIKKGFGNYCSKKCSNKGNNLGFKKGHPNFLTEKSKKKIAKAVKERWRILGYKKKVGKKISEANKGRKLFEEHKKKISIALKGRKLSEEHRRKIREKSIFQKGHNLNKGRIYIKKGIFKICPNCKKEFYVHKADFNRRHYCSRECLFNSLIWKKEISKRQKGRKLKEETKRKLSIAFQGENSSLWLGGKSFEPYSKN